jgi:Rhodopirellula transposase DDE domain
VIAVDSKKKELIGNNENKIQQWLFAKQSLQVQGHNFPAPGVPRAFPYVISDIGRDAECVNFGTDHDAGDYAVATIREWCRGTDGESMRMLPRF